jgi:hypothetical protein
MFSRNGKIFHRNLTSPTAPVPFIARVYTARYCPRSIRNVAIILTLQSIHSGSHGIVLWSTKVISIWGDQGGLFFQVKQERLWTPFLDWLLCTCILSSSPQLPLLASRRSPTDSPQLVLTSKQTLLDLTSIDSASAATISNLRPVFLTITVLVLLTILHPQFVDYLGFFSEAHVKQWVVAGLCTPNLFTRHIYKLGSRILSFYT